IANAAATLATSSAYIVRHTTPGGDHVSLPVLTAVTGARWESDLVSNLEHSPRGVSGVRRCVDRPDLLPPAASGQARAVLLSADLRRLDRESVTRLLASGVAVVGVTTPGDQEGEDRLHRLGITHVIPADAAPEVLAAAVTEAVEQVVAYADAPNMYATAVADPRAQLPNLPPVEELPAQPPATSTGQLIAVWGPAGAPGRTSVAVGVASELALFGAPTLLADAD